MDQKLLVVNKKQITQEVRIRRYLTGGWKGAKVRAGGIQMLLCNRELKSELPGGLVRNMVVLLPGRVGVGRQKQILDPQHEQKREGPHSAVVYYYYY